MPGPVGGGLYMSHADVYCNQVKGAGPGNAMTLVVECDSGEDLGLTGTCYGQGRADVYLNGSRPAGWSSIGTKPQWVCSWAPSSGTALVNLPDATAEICCIRKQ